MSASDRDQASRAEPAPGPARRGPGRPADPGIESRLFAAALVLYAQVGWAGFTIHAVATKAKVGKAAIYRRWPNKEELIGDAIMSIYQRAAPDTGSLRGDLVATVEGELRDYLSPDGLVRLRALVEAKVYPDHLGVAAERLRRHRNQAGRTMIANAVRRGELSGDTNIPQLLDAIGGMTLNHFLSLSKTGLAALEGKKRRAFAESVVDFALAAAAHQSV